MISQKIRRNFLQFFQERGHTIVPSSPVVPHDDPTLLFINAGMNQFKDVFLGSSKRDYTRACSSQKCIRVGGKHNDLDNVGHTDRHLTFFEMLGNFSFGDYFKKEAIAFAWELTEKVFEFDPEFLWISVFEEDDEAYELWKAHVPESRIVRMNAAENFWSMGETGPCGPCSELYYDKGEKYGTGTNPANDPTGDRFIEFWNLVFMQYNRDQNGKMSPLPNQSIDAGSGLERVVSLKMGVDHIFHTDILRHLIDRTQEVTGKKYDPSDKKLAPAFHVIADHIRSLGFAIADGAQPSNIERGYVLRKLLRRAVRYGRTLLGVEKPFLVDVFPALVETMGEDFPELQNSKQRIQEILQLEEEGFLRTLKRGGNILQSIVEESLAKARKQISGEDAFKLKDTYGFPLEEIMLIAKDSGLEINLESYQLLEEKAKELSRGSRQVEGQEATENVFAEFVENAPPCQFVGYVEYTNTSKIIALMKNGSFVDSLGAEEEGAVLLETTCFYAEKGGQVGDRGIIFTDQAHMEIQDCKTPYPNVIVHHGKVSHGTLSVGDTVTASIDAKRRQFIAAHHTATHLLHYALQKVLGSHIKQAGSLVEEDRLRFDFNHHKSISPAEIEAIEDMVNEKIRGNQQVSTYEIPFQEAQNHPDIEQIFGEKYGAIVRVVDIDYSKELCGGTHAPDVGSLGYFRILKESSIASGVRRIEAACGPFAEQFVREKEKMSQNWAALLKTTPAQFSGKLEHLLQEANDLKVKVKALSQAQVHQLATTMASNWQDPILCQIIDLSSDELPELADALMQQKQSGILALATTSDDKLQLAVRVSKDWVEKGVTAPGLIKQISSLIKGGGGGRPESAQAGGKNPDGLPEAFNTIQSLVAKL